MTELENIRKRFAKLIYKTDVPSRHDAEKFYSTLCEGDTPGMYFWRDIDYKDEARSSWQAAEHYDRIIKILKGYGEKKLRDKVLVKKLSGAIKFWAYHSFKNPNWWYNDIGMPRAFGDIGLMMYDVLDRETLASIQELAGQGSVKNRPMAMLNDSDELVCWAGQNLIWGAANTLRHALLTNDSELLKQASSLAASEITMGEHEGIQTDGSFFQHGRLLYSGGYGKSFALDIAALAYILDGTQYCFYKEKLDTFLVHILDGLRHMTVGKHLDWQCTGREYVRPGGTSAAALKDMLKLMRNTSGMWRASETSEYLHELCGGKKPDSTKYFDVAHMLCHHTNGLYIGARFSANDIKCAEICNNENVLGANLSYGTSTCIMRTGEEYADIAPLWNYSRIPGTTSRTESDDELLMRNSWQTYRLPSDISGGYQKGSRALIYQLADHDGIQALVCDFAFEGGFVCLGTEIKDTSGKNEGLVTTIDQTRLTGEMFEDDISFYHNGICYRSLDGKKIYDSSPRVSGSWTRNNLNYPDSEQVSGEILTLEIRHPAGEASSYAYLICVEDNEPDVRVLRNDSAVQAILLPDNTVMAVFHKAAELETPQGTISGTPGCCIRERL